MPLYIDQWTNTWSDTWGVESGQLPSGIIPVVDLTTQDILYGSRTTSYRFELLAHQADGTDSLTGYLDGVIPGGTATWQSGSPVAGDIQLNVLDLHAAQPGMTRIGDVDLESVRIRPVLIIEGLPDIPLGVFLVSGAPEQWSDEDRVYQLRLLDRTTVLDQDQVAASFTAVTGTAIMTQIANLIATSNEKFSPNNSETRGLSAPMVWPVGTPKLQIVNDLLAALNYSQLTIAGSGDFLTAPITLPALRPITYGLLNGVARQLVDGEMGIYQPDWTRDRPFFGVPNRIVAVGVSSGSAAPVSGSYSNTDPSSPFSYASRGRWITQTVQNVQVPTGSDPTAFLTSYAQQQLIAQSSPAATITVTHLPLPLALGDVVEFASTPAGIDARHVVTQVQLDLTPTGLMQSTLQEVVAL